MPHWVLTFELSGINTLFTGDICRAYWTYRSNMLDI